MRGGIRGALISALALAAVVGCQEQAGGGGSGAGGCGGAGYNGGGGGAGGGGISDVTGSGGYTGGGSRGVGATGKTPNITGPGAGTGGTGGGNTGGQWGPVGMPQGGYGGLREAIPPPPLGPLPPDAFIPPLPPGWEGPLPAMPWAGRVAECPQLDELSGKLDQATKRMLSLDTQQGVGGSGPAQAAADELDAKVTLLRRQLGQLQEQAQAKMDTGSRADLRERADALSKSIAQLRDEVEGKGTGGSGAPEAEQAKGPTLEQPWARVLEVDGTIQSLSPERLGIRNPAGDVFNMELPSGTAVTHEGKRVSTQELKEGTRVHATALASGDRLYAAQIDVKTKSPKKQAEARQRGEPVGVPPGESSPWHGETR